MDNGASPPNSTRPRSCSTASAVGSSPTSDASPAGSRPAIAQVLRKRHRRSPKVDSRSDSGWRTPAVGSLRSNSNGSFSRTNSPTRRPEATEADRLDRLRTSIAAKDRPRVESSLASSCSTSGRPNSADRSSRSWPGDRRTEPARGDRSGHARQDRRTTTTSSAPADGVGPGPRGRSPRGSGAGRDAAGDVALARRVGAGRHGRWLRDVLSRPVVAFLALAPRSAAGLPAAHPRPGSPSPATTCPGRRPITSGRRWSSPASPCWGGWHSPVPSDDRVVLVEHLASSRLAVAVDHVATELAYFILAAGRWPAWCRRAGRTPLRWKPATRCRSGRRLLLVTWIAVIFAIGIDSAIRKNSISPISAACSSRRSRS